MGMTRTQINVEVDPETKEEWQRYVEDSSEFKHLSELIRFAVARYTAGSAGTADVDLSPVMDRFEDLSAELRDVKAGVETVETRLDRNGDIDALASDVIDLLPTEPELATDMDVEHRPGEGLWLIGGPSSLLSGESERAAADVPPDVLGRTGHPDAIAHAMGKSAIRVERTLEKLDSETAMVRSIEADGRRRYYTVE